LPIVIVGEATHGSLDTTEHDRNVGIELLEYLAIYDRGVLGAQVVATVGV
jgi:hypothetical protein